ncbi:MAG TPA: AAA family ATPase [Acidimicrobiales bacterium]|jgi:ABC-type Mn2+/Zn2+ transport system ATPase subunit|nr:AAA family ATPase [Acidimicrobiales bacterium]
MAQNLRNEIARRLDAGGVPAEVRELVLNELPDDGHDAPAAAGGAYLAKLSVEGFRGVGERLDLELQPAPGLTLIVGRNGSGKSSLAESFEVLLTGDSARWAGKKQKAWRDGWKNLHSAGPARVAASIIEEGRSGFTDIERTWASSDLDNVATVVRRPGSSDAAEIPWTGSLTAHRPFLSYNELGGLLEDGSATLFAALSSILGLESLTEAANALGERRREVNKRLKAATDTAKTLVVKLKSADDERARRAASALAAKVPDLAVIDEIIVPGGDAPDADLSQLRSLATLHAPDPEAALQVADELEAAVAEAERVRSTDAGRALSTAALLEAALEHHQHHPTTECPVCGSAGVLADAWAEKARAEAAALRAAAEDAEHAQRNERERRRMATAFLSGPPAVVSSASTNIDTSGLASMWGAFAQPASDDTQLLRRLREDVKPLAAAIEAVRGQAVAEIEARQDAWKPLATELAAWRQQADVILTAPEEVKRLKAAEDWLKKAEEELRAERFAPIAERATEVWQTLRQQSSVDLKGIKLAGASAKYGRKDVVLDVSIDGVEGAALSVMSQGELHSLALSLFMPRALMPESPFRFVVIDDPVQAMDPAKVEGLAQVLHRAAETHQVIVLTHDERLPEAMRRLDIPATVLEVSRGERSRVMIEKSLDPVERHLRDARSLLRGNLPESIRATVVPALCRSALEAACIEVYQRRELTNGRPHAKVEADLVENDDLGARLALAFGCERGAVNDALRTRCPREEAQAVYDCNRGVHEGFPGDLDDLLKRTRALAKTIRALT